MCTGIWAFFEARVQVVHGHVHGHVHRHVYGHVYTHVHGHVYKHVCMCMYRRVYRHVYRHVCRHVCRHMHGHVYEHVYAYLQTRVKTCVHTCVQTTLHNAVVHGHGIRKVLGSMDLGVFVDTHVKSLICRHVCIHTSRARQMSPTRQWILHRLTKKVFLNVGMSSGMGIDLPVHVGFISMRVFQRRVAHA